MAGSDLQTAVHRPELLTPMLTLKLISLLRGFPLVCPMCGGQMCLIAFVTEGAQITKILVGFGVD